MDFLINLFTDRLVTFSVVTFFFILETFWPYLIRPKSRTRHSLVNIGLLIVFILATSPINYLGVLWFSYIDKNEIGLLHQVSIHPFFKIIIGFLILDLGDYFYHRITHIWKVLWSFHRVHHTDQYMDSTTAYRFHPFENIAQLSIQILTSYIFGYSIETIAIYYSVNIPLVIIQHVNIKFPDWMENNFVYIIATPNFHRVHHSYPQHLTDSNYGNIFSFWDRLFGTYNKVDPKKLVFGLEDTDEKHQGLWYMVTSPFRK